MQPDNNLQEPYNTQNYNRYGYVLNNPLKYTDPTGEFTWSDLVSGLAIVAGAILVVVGGPAGVLLGYKLIGAGVTHFGATATRLANNGGTWDEASNYVGFNSPTIEIPTNLVGGGKKDVANNNNPVESHPQVASAANPDEISYAAFSKPPGSDNFNFFDRNSTIDKGLWYVANNDNMNTKGVVKVYANGGFEGMMLNGNFVTSASKISDLLYDRSPSWRNFRDNGGKLTLVLKSCTTGQIQKSGAKNIAQSLSQEFNGLTVIAPSDYWHIQPTYDGGFPKQGLQDNGTWNFNGGWTIPVWNGGWIDDGVKNNGTWNFYYNGNLIKSNDGK